MLLQPPADGSVTRCHAQLWLLQVCSLCSRDLQSQWSLLVHCPPINPCGQLRCQTATP